MAKKWKGKSKKPRPEEELVGDSKPILELNYSDPLFQLRFHPSKALFFSGLGTGYIYCYAYDTQKLQKILDDNRAKYDISNQKEKEIKLWTCQQIGGDSEANESNSPVKLVWKTKRHKGSVRGLCLDNEGNFIYSIGTDNVLKKAEAESGRVVKKIKLNNQKGKITKLIKSPTHPYLLLGDEDGNVMVLNSEKLELINEIKKIHNCDAVNDIFNFSKRSVHKYISLGQTTLAYWDARESNETDFDINENDKDAKRKVLLSDDQEDELLCGTFVDPEVGDTVVCGMGEGILTVWKPKKNDLEDQVNRIKICKNESIDCIVPTLQDDNCVWCGCSNGKIYKADVKSGRIVEVRKHSSIDEVAFLDLDFEYRITSGGMDKVLIWEFKNEEPNGTDEEEESFEDSSSSSSEEEDAEDEQCDSDTSDVWEKLEENNAKGNSDDDSEDNSVNNTDDDSDNNTDDQLNLDPSDTKNIGLSREELIAELNKDIMGDNESDQEATSKRLADDHSKDLKKRKEKKRKIAKDKPYNNSHGITKFEGL